MTILSLPPLLAACCLFSSALGRFRDPPKEPGYRWGANSFAAQEAPPRWRWYYPDGDLTGCSETGQYLNRSNGIDLWYTVCGPQDTGKTPLLFQHGGTGSSHQFSEQVKELVKTRPLILQDMRGQGRSPYTGFTDFHYDDFADDAVALLDHLNIQKVALLGWSDGAIIGLNMALRYPDRLERLFSLGATLNCDMSKPGTNDPIINSKDGVLVSDPPSGVTYAEKRSLEKRVDKYDCENISPTKDKCSQMRQKIGELYNKEPTWGKNDMKKIKTPVWIASGDHDTDIERNQYDAQVAWIPFAGQLIFPQVAHPAHRQDPTFFNFALQNFLDLKFDGQFPEY